MRPYLYIIDHLPSEVLAKYPDLPEKILDAHQTHIGAFQPAPLLKEDIPYIMDLGFCWADTNHRNYWEDFAQDSSVRGIYLCP